MFPSVVILGALSSPFQDNYQICSHFQALEQMRWPYHQIRRFAAQSIIFFRTRAIRFSLESTTSQRIACNETFVTV